MNEALALGSLCSGYGGLDIAATELLNAAAVWCAEFEDAPSQVLEARFPDVPNVHDVKRIPWHIMAPIDVLTAGYPCQPFSLAGARKGEDDERHLWPSIAEGIRIMRPRHVLLENVRGHLSLGFDQVLHDLNAMGYSVVWRILAASAVGVCHRRERLWIYAQPAEFVAPASSPVLAVAGSETWLDAEEDLFGDRMAWTGQLPAAGVMHSGEIRAVSMPAPLVAGPLFPTPDASVANDGEGPETWLARRERVRAKGINGNGMGMPLTIAVQMLPTPTASDHTGSGGQHEQHVTLTDAIVRTKLGTRPNPRLLPTPDAYQSNRGGSQDPEKRRAGGHTVSLADVVEKGLALLPTPQAHDHVQGKTLEQVDAMRARTGAGVRNLNEVSVHELLPTPSAALATGGQRSGRRKDELLLGGILLEVATAAEWGKYTDAIERHALMLERAPEPPTQPNTKGNPELAPRFVEWMMCLPTGWVTDPALWEHLTPRKARDAQLKMLGNGVVWVCALAAYRSLATVAAGRREAIAA